MLVWHQPFVVRDRCMGLFSLSLVVFTEYAFLRFLDLLSAEWQITAEESIVNATTGGSLSIKCMHNFPQEDIVFLTWSRLDGGALDETRTSIYNVFHKGYSQLEITNINYHDAGVYHCQGLITTPDGNTNLYRSAVVTITVTGEGLSDENQ